MPSQERWEAMLRSSDPDLQARVVAMATEVADQFTLTAIGAT